MKQRAKKRLQRDNELLTSALTHNYHAMVEGPRKKKWTMHDIVSVRPKTETQRTMFESWNKGHSIAAVGSAGTGKTFCALYLALTQILDYQSPQKTIIIVRSAEPTKSVGFLPGTLEEKLQVYEQPYKDTLTTLFGKASTYDDMKSAGMIQFMSTSYIRGLNWDDAVVIFDEAQNATLHEIHSVMTRMGTNSRIMLLGDLRQDDLKGSNSKLTSGLSSALCAVDYMPRFDTIEFTRQDIVRSEFVRAWIVATEETKVFDEQQVSSRGRR